MDEPQDPSKRYLPVYLPPILIRFITIPNTKKYFKPRSLEDLNLNSRPNIPLKNAELGFFYLSGQGKTINPVTYLWHGEAISAPPEYNVDFNHTFGDGGNITGFFDVPDDDHKLNDYVTEFGGEGSKDVIVLLTTLFEGRVNTPMFYTAGEITEDGPIPLNQPIVPCRGAIKVAQLGNLMDRANHYEVNFITNECIQLPAIRLQRYGKDLRSMLNNILDWLSNGVGPDLYILGASDSPVLFGECSDVYPAMENNEPCEHLVEKPTEDLSDTDMNGGRKSKSNKPKKTRKTSRKPKSKTRRSKSRY